MPRPSLALLSPSTFSEVPTFMVARRIEVIAMAENDTCPNCGTVGKNIDKAVAMKVNFECIDTGCRVVKFRSEV